MGRMLEAKRLENELSGVINPSFNGFNIHICVDNSTFNFPSRQVLKKISSSVPLSIFNSSLYTFWKLKKVELVKNDFQKAQLVTHFCYWTLFLIN